LFPLSFQVFGTSLPSPQGTEVAPRITISVFSSSVKHDGQITLVGPYGESSLIAHSSAAAPRGLRNLR
jgi:hypothetical protein